MVGVGVVETTGMVVVGIAPVASTGAITGGVGVGAAVAGVGDLDADRRDVRRTGIGLLVRPPERGQREQGHRARQQEAASVGVVVCHAVCSILPAVGQRVLGRADQG